MSISSTSNVNVLHQLTGPALPPGAGRGNALGKANAAGKDQFLLSPSAGMLQQFLTNGVDGKENTEDALSSLDMLKQHGELLAGLLKTKLKNFESGLASGMQAAGLDPTQQMNMQQGVDGLLLTNSPPDKDQITKLLGGNGALQDQFKELSRLAELLGSLQQTGNHNAAGSSVAAQYARQSPQTAAPVKSNPDARFVLSVMQGNSSYTFE